jgi:N-acetylglucosamine-6-phosphate deacetylase
VVKTIVRAKSPARVALVTDAIAAAARPPGPFTLGGLRAHRHESGRVTLAGTDDLAGSSLTLDHAVARAVEFTGLSIDDVLPMASTVPAAAVGLAPAGTLTATWDQDALTFTVDAVAGG